MKPRLKQLLKLRRGELSWARGSDSKYDDSKRWSS